MDVVTRKEFCDDFHNRENGEKVEVRLADVPAGTVFRARTTSLNYLHVWLKINDYKDPSGDAVCVGEPSGGRNVGDLTNCRRNIILQDYEELNATIVID